MRRLTVCLLFCLLIGQFLNLPQTASVIGLDSASFLIILNAALFMFDFLGYIRPSGSAKKAYRKVSSSDDVPDLTGVATAQEKPRSTTEPS